MLSCCFICGGLRSLFAFSLRRKVPRLGLVIASLPVDELGRNLEDAH